MKSNSQRIHTTGTVIDAEFREIQDDSDDLFSKTAGKEPTPTDAVEDEHGPLIFIDKASVKLNPPAIAQKFAIESAVAFSMRDDAFYRHDHEAGIWVKLKKQRVVWLMSIFLKTIADQTKAVMVLPKRTASMLNSLVELIKGCAQLGDPPPPAAKLLPVANGVLELSGVEPVLRPYRKEDWFTSKLQVPYEKGARCDRFLNELVRPALVDPNDVSLLQRDLGRQLIPGNDAQMFSVIFGEGGSGKGVLVSIHEKIIGEDRIAHLRSDQLKGRFETHAYHGKSTLVGKDVKPDYLSNSGAAMIKSLTGADRIESEKKYGGKFELRGTFFIVITANTRLPIKLEGDASAWGRRLVCYNFTRKAPAKRTPNFDDELIREEGSGILAWWVEGYMAHQTELRDHGTLRLTLEQERRVDDWIMESEGETAFARTQISKGAGTLSVEEIWQGYAGFALPRGWKLPSKQVFCTRLPGIMMDLFNADRDHHIMRNGSAVRGYKGVIFTAERGDLLARNEAAKRSETSTNL